MSRGKNRFHFYILHITLLISTAGLFVSFSRAGIIALLGMVVVLAMFSLKNWTFSLIYKPLVVLGGAILLSVAILSPFLTTRATVSDNATKERVFYNKIGLNMIDYRPIQGIGPGTSVLHMKHLSEQPLEPWEIQPIHNYYLISWAELGIGALLLLFLIIYPIFALFKSKFSMWNAIVLSLLASFLILFLFDHYFYTIWPTQLLLWLVIGLALSSTWNMEDPIYDTSSQK